MPPTSDRGPMYSFVRLGLPLVALAVPPPAAAGFVEVSEEITSYRMSDITYGLGWGDFDLDGDRDCFVSRHFRAPTVYWNNGDGTMDYQIFPPLFETAEDHHGGLIADLDGDGDLDIYLTGGADAGTSEVDKKMYRNDGPDEIKHLRWKNVATDWGLEDSDARGRASSAMDVDGDGDVDLFVAKAAREASPNSLFINDGTPFFTDQAASAGLADSFGSVGGLWNDYDNDGDPDLFISGEEELTFETRLYRNDGNVSFSDVTAKLLPGIGQVAAARFADYDHDGDQDLAVGLGDRALFDAVAWDADSIRFFFNTRFGDNGLDGLSFVQSGDSATYDLALDGAFQPEAIVISESAYNPTQTPFSLPWEINGAPPFTPGTSLAFYIWTQEFLDVWEMRCNAPPMSAHSFAGIITSNGDFTGVSAVGIEPYTPGPRGTRLWRNDGGVFTDVTSASGIADSVNAHFLDWIDVDQDGWLDLYVCNKGDTELLNQPNVFYRNLGDGTFADETAAQGLEGPVKGLGDSFAFEDYDDDGDQDVILLSGTGPIFLAGLEETRIYRNDGPVGNFLRVDLEGTLSTRDGYGAWVTCVSAAAGRQVHYVTGNNWRGGQYRLEPFFGLGADAVVDSLIVDWPSGHRDVLTGVAAGDVVVVETSPPVAAPLPAPARLDRLRIGSAPQPASGVVRLSFSGRREMPAVLRIFDASGRRVFERRLPAGANAVSWDGRNGEGQRVGAGVYFARLTEGSRSADRKIVRMAP